MQLAVPLVWTMMLCVLLPLIILFGVGVAFIGWLGRRRRSRDHAESSDEARLIQEMYTRLEGMATRIEHLETLLLEKEIEHLEHETESAHERD